VWNVERQTTVGELVEGGRQVRYFFAMTNVETSPDYSAVISRIVPGRMTCEAERTWGARFEPVAIQVCAGRALRLVDAIPTPPDLEELPVLAGWLGARPLNDLRAFLVKSEGLAGQGVRLGDYLLVGQPGNDRPSRLSLAEVDGHYVLRRGSEDPQSPTLIASEAKTIGPVLAVIRKRGEFRRTSVVPRCDPGSPPKMSAAARLRGQLGMVESTYAVTRNPRLRRALRNEAALLRRRLQNGAFPDKTS